MDKVLTMLVIVGLITMGISGYALMPKEKTIEVSHSTVPFATQFYDNPVASTVIIPLEVYQMSVHPGQVYQGPVRPTDNELKFRQTGVTE